MKQKQKTVRQLEKELAAVEDQLHVSNHKDWGPRQDQKGDARFSSGEFLKSVAVVEDARHRRDELREKLVFAALNFVNVQHTKPNLAAGPGHQGLSTQCQDLVAAGNEVDGFDAIIRTFEAIPDWSERRDKVVALWAERERLSAEIAARRQDAAHAARAAREAQERHIEDAKRNLPESVRKLWSRAKEIAGNE